MHDDLVNEWMDEANKRLGEAKPQRETSVFADWERRVRQGGVAQSVTFQGEPIVWDDEYPYLVYGDSVQCAPGFDPAWAEEDEGAGCSDEAQWNPWQASEFEMSGLLVIDVLPDDPRECRRMLSAQLQGFGDRAWREIQKRKGWSDDGRGAG